MALGMLGTQSKAYLCRRDLNQVAPAGLVCSPAPSDSPSLMCPRDWLWLTRAVITALVATDVDGSSSGSGSSRPGGGPGRSSRPGRTTAGRRRSLPGLRAAASAHPMAAKRETVTRHDLPDEMALILNRGW